MIYTIEGHTRYSSCSLMEMQYRTYSNDAFLFVRKCYFSLYFSLAMVMDIRTGVQWAFAPYFSKSWTQCPILCILVALLENSKGTKINRRIHVSGNFRGPGFQNFLGEHAPCPLADLQADWCNINPFSTCKMFCQKACFIQCCCYACTVKAQ